MATEKRIPRVRIHEDNFSEESKYPSYMKEAFDNYGLKPQDFFIEVVNAKDEVIALFFIVDGYDLGYGKVFLSEELDSFVTDFDMWLTPNYQWEDIEYLRWLPEHLGEERMQALLKDVGISDVNELEYNKIPEGWKDTIGGDDLYGPESSHLPALLLMAYGRLKYPYRLTKEIRENCETYIWKFSGRLTENWGGVGDLKKYYPGEFRDLVTFCADLFSNKETFRDALLNLL